MASSEIRWYNILCAFLLILSFHIGLRMLYDDFKFNYTIYLGLQFIIMLCFAGLFSVSMGILVEKIKGDKNGIKKIC